MDELEEKTSPFHSRAVYVQVAIVILGFSLLVFLSALFIGNIVNKHMHNSIETAFKDTEINITADLNELETLLHYISETIRMMILEDRNFGMVASYMTGITWHIMLSDERLKEYATGIYGVFDVFGGRFHDGTGWKPPESFIPHERPWYDAAVTADGKVGITDPYMSVAWDSYTLTFSRRIFDSDGTPLGIICLDILLDHIRDYAVNMSFTQGGYGLLLNRNMEVLAHPDQMMWGRELRDIDDGYKDLADDLEQGVQIIERRMNNYKKEPCVVSFRQLENGWYIGMVIHEETYFKEMRKMRRTLIIIGIALAALFITIVLRLSQARKELQYFKDEPNLTIREHEIFNLLLKG
ncbi:MAG: cache domain-containing protein, partial [Treponema sp.]|nr:cache domain-containing protein [Treponema sp.]